MDASNNVLLQNQPAGNHWVIETKVDGEALNQHYQQAGLTAYADGQNYVKLDYITDNDPGTPLKRRFELRTVVGGVVGQPQPSVNDLTAGTWYLRLERTDNNFTGYYSADGAAWTKFSDTVANIPVASSGKVGIFAVGVDQASSGIGEVRLLPRRRRYRRHRGPGDIGDRHSGRRQWSKRLVHR